MSKHSFISALSVNSQNAINQSVSVIFMVLLVHFFMATDLDESVIHRVLISKSKTSTSHVILASPLTQVNANQLCHLFTHVGMA